MQLFRLVKKRYAANPLDPQGARLYGGRWNSPGRGVVYASDSIALSLLEKLVHLHSFEVLEQFVLCTLELDESRVMSLAAEALPPDWQAEPPPRSTQVIGDQWLERGESLALAVPSVLVPRQWNYLLNPLHPDFARLQADLVVEPFRFDERLARR
jgi:RES domain-containing protein